MPISYQIDPASGLVRMRVVDAVSLAETIDALRALGADPAAPARLDLLVDLRHTPGLPDSGQLRSIASELGRMAPKLHWGACALVASSDSVYGVSRMFAVYAESAFERVQVFRTLDEAEAWLASARAQASGSAI
jgi:hypothetical protein